MIPEIVSLLDADDFYVVAHAIVFRAMVELQNENIAVDLLTLAERLKRFGKLEEIGGEFYLADLWNAAPSVNFRHYADMIRDQAVKRTAMYAGRDIAELAVDPSASACEVREFAEESLPALLDSRPGDETRHASKTVSELYEALDRRRARGGESSGVTSGLASLDGFTGGFQPGTLIVIAARPGISDATNLMRRLGGLLPKPNLKINGKLRHGPQKPCTHCEKKWLHGSLLTAESCPQCGSPS